MATKAGLYGSIEPNGNNWRAALKIGGMYSKGPTRAAREEAVEDLRALNLARPGGLNAVVTCAGALQAIASAQRQARSASSTTQCGRSKEPSSQSTAVRANPSVGLDTHRSKPIVSMGPKRRRISSPPTRSVADEKRPYGQGGIERNSTAGTFRAHKMRDGYKGIGPYRAARSAADEDRRILCDASAQGTDALRVASQRLLKEAADTRVLAEASECLLASCTSAEAYVNLDPLHVRPVRPRPSCPQTFSPGPSRLRVSRPRPSRLRLSVQDPPGLDPPDLDRLDPDPQAGTSTSGTNPVCLLWSVPKYGFEP